MNGAASVQLPKPRHKPLRWRFRYPPVTANSMYFTRPNGARRLRPIAEQWMNECVALIRDGGQPKTPPGLLSFRLAIWPPDHRRRDGSNLLKITEDAVAIALGFDDYRIAHHDIRRHAPIPGGRIEVELATDTEATPLATEEAR